MSKSKEVRSSPVVFGPKRFTPIPGENALGHWLNIVRVERGRMSIASIIRTLELPGLYNAATKPEGHISLDTLYRIRAGAQKLSLSPMEISHLEGVILHIKEGKTENDLKENSHLSPKAAAKLAKDTGRFTDSSYARYANAAGLSSLSHTETFRTTRKLLGIGSVFSPEEGIMILEEMNKRKKPAQNPEDI